MRTSSGLTQAEISSQLGFKRNTWSNWENGISSPDIDTLRTIAAHFNVNISDIIEGDLAQNVGKSPEKSKRPAAKERTEPNIMSTGLQPYTNRNPAVVSVGREGDENIVYVPVKAQAGYLVGYGDTSYIEQLPAFNMPGLRNGTFRMFEVQGVSMSPTLSDSDRVIGEWISSVDEIRENRVHVMVLRDGICIKRVLNRVRERGKLYLKSDTLTHRQDYPIREIEPSDVLEIWYVRMKVSGDLSEPSEIYNRVSDLEINQLEIMKRLGIAK